MLVSTTLFVFLAIFQPISCWGSFGHRTVAYLAQKHFTAGTHRFVDRLLENDQGFDISDASLWADGRVKRDNPRTRQWHWIDAKDKPPTHCEVNYQRDCEDNGTPECIISAITNMTRVLSKPSNEYRKEALMFLIHFLGDIHQPLHTENASRGGTQLDVRFDNRNEDLHGVWDSDILHKYRHLPSSIGQNKPKEREEARKWADELYQSKEDKNMQLCKKGPECYDIKKPQKCALLWASEANCRICTHVLKPKVKWLENNDLGGEYYEDAVPVVVDLVRKSGLRLGAWLNALAAIQPSEEDLVVQDPEVDGEL